MHYLESNTACLSPENLTWYSRDYGSSMIIGTCCAAQKIIQKEAKLHRESGHFQEYSRGQYQSQLESVCWDQFD